MPRRLWLLTVLGAAVSLAAGCGRASLSAGPPAAERWLEIVTPHYVIATDVAEPHALAMAQALEDLRAALLAAMWPRAEAPRGRTRVMVFARQRELSRYAGRNTAGAVFTRPGFERLLAFAAGSLDGVPAVAAHELAHDLSRWFLPVQPLWLAEGLAMELESVQLDRTGHQVVTGGLSPGMIEWLRSVRSIPSASQLFALSQPRSVDSRDATSFYLGAWALVHYLRSERPQGFARFQQSLTQLTPWRQAWQQSFPGLTAAALDRELRAHLRSARLVPRWTSFTPPVFTPVLRALSPAEVHGTRALLANTSGESAGKVEMAAALELDPNELEALRVRFHSLGSRAREARAEIAERAINAHPHRAEAWLLGALAAEHASERQRALARAEQLDPDHPGVAALLAEAALARNDTRAALAQVRHAQRRSGVTPRNLALLFAALATANRCQDAATVLERSPLLLRPQCRVMVGASQRPVTCESYVRWAYAPRSRCSFEASRTTGSPERAPSSQAGARAPDDDRRSLRQLRQGTALGMFSMTQVGKRSWSTALELKLPLSGL